VGIVQESREVDDAVEELLVGAGARVRQSRPAGTDPDKDLPRRIFELRRGDEVERLQREAHTFGVTLAALRLKNSAQAGDALVESFREKGAVGRGGDSAHESLAIVKCGDDRGRGVGAGLELRLGVGEQEDGDGTDEVAAVPRKQCAHLVFRMREVTMRRVDGVENEQDLDVWV